ncbi:hypothetical protein BH23BAC4_BH23BAC4_14140 [soil metagenome]
MHHHTLMKTLRNTFALGLLALLLAAVPMTAFAQSSTTSAPAVPEVTTETATEEAAEAQSLIEWGRFPNMRAPNQSGVLQFEPPTSELGVGPYPRVRLGGAFTQQFQGLSHSNTADERTLTGPAGPYNANQLMNIGAGFNLATANLNLNVLLTEGVMVDLVTYLSSRHHPEAWVKGGYLQVDSAPFLGSPLVDDIMQYLSLRVGHFEINYGDAHFRRTDNGNAFYNPFVGNLIMDAFTTEIGGEVYFRHDGALAMVGITGGEIQGNVLNPDNRSFSIYSKVGLDREVMPNLRTRLTGSVYHNGNSASNSLYGGDRAGSRYYFAMENVVATTAGNFTSGHINPGFRKAVTSFMINPFVKYHGLELFGTLETTGGRAAVEAEDIGRSWTQFAVEGIYRFLPREQLYVGARYNRVAGPLQGPVVQGQVTEAGSEISINRLQVGAGWFALPNVLVKAEYVNQRYNDFPGMDIRSGGRFNGFMIEGAILF